MPSWPCAEAVDLAQQRSTRANKYRSRQCRPLFLNSVQLAGSGGQLMQRQRKTDLQVWFHSDHKCSSGWIWSAFTPLGLIYFLYTLFLSVCLSTVLAPHFNSLPCVALAATYHIPNLETEPFMKEREIVSRMRSERPPPLKVLQHRVANVELRQVKFPCDFCPTWSCVSNILTWGSVNLNQMSVVLLS